MDLELSIKDIEKIEIKEESLRTKLSKTMRVVSIGKI